MIHRLLTIAGVSFLALTIAHASEHGAEHGTTWIHPFDVPQIEDAPEELLAVIEIPHGSVAKYELDKETGYPVIDRYQSMPVEYPANYGCFPSTLGGDNDALDVLVYTREPIQSGAFIKVRPIGMLIMVDGGEEDQKVVAVPASDVDPTYDNIKELEDLPEMDRERLEAFFRVYKQLPKGSKQVELDGFRDRIEALKIISRDMENYQATKKAAEEAATAGEAVPATAN